MVGTGAACSEPRRVCICTVGQKVARGSSTDRPPANSGGPPPTPFPSSVRALSSAAYADTYHVRELFHRNAELQQGVKKDSSPWVMSRLARRMEDRCPLPFTQPLSACGPSRQPSILIESGALRAVERWFVPWTAAAPPVGQIEPASATTSSDLPTIGRAHRSGAPFTPLPRRLDRISMGMALGSNGRPSTARTALSSPLLRRCRYQPRSSSTYHHDGAAPSGGTAKATSTSLLCELRMHVRASTISPGAARHGLIDHTSRSRIEAALRNSPLTSSGAARSVCTMMYRAAPHGSDRHRRVSGSIALEV
jgi:hypothetical protein